MRGWSTPSSRQRPTSRARPALVSVASPWVTRRWKRALWAWVIVLVVLRVLGSGEAVLDVVLAAAVGVVIGSLSVLLFGSPNPEPGALELLRGLRACGIQPLAIERAVNHSDAHHFVVHESDQPTRFVKVRTPDDRNSDLLNRLYHAIRLRSSEVERPYSTLKRRVEHEALLLLSSAAAGAGAPRWSPSARPTAAPLSSFSNISTARRQPDWPPKS